MRADEIAAWMTGHPAIAQGHVLTAATALERAVREVHYLEAGLAQPEVDSREVELRVERITTRLLHAVRALNAGSAESPGTQRELERQTRAAFSSLGKRSVSLAVEREAEMERAIRAAFVAGAQFADPNYNPGAALENYLRELLTFGLLNPNR